MNTYIVRIYRRDARDPQQIVGRVEDAESGDRQTFHNASELVRLLGGRGAEASAARKMARSG
jgi:hypothetical protein